MAVRASSSCGRHKGTAAASRSPASTRATSATCGGGSARSFRVAGATFDVGAQQVEHARRRRPQRKPCTVLCGGERGARRTVGAAMSSTGHGRSSAVEFEPLSSSGRRGLLPGPGTADRVSGRRRATGAIDVRTVHVERRSRHQQGHDVDMAPRRSYGRCSAAPFSLLVQLRVRHLMSACLTNSTSPPSAASMSWSPLAIPGLNRNVNATTLAIKDPFIWETPHNRSRHIQCRSTAS